MVDISPRDQIYKFFQTLGLEEIHIGETSKYIEHVEGDSENCPIYTITGKMLFAPENIKSANITLYKDGKTSDIVEVSGPRHGLHFDKVGEEQIEFLTTVEFSPAGPNETNVKFTIPEYVFYGKKDEILRKMNQIVQITSPSVR